ncbi:MAG: glucosamine-6-phosphate deaminase [Acidobacteriaceae bacterium]|nr:glucosamine-6-phosphate deaminase [Acidobacteriaceae bacterium]
MPAPAASSTQLKLHALPTPAALGRAAAEQAASAILNIAARQESIPVVFATGASQLETLRALTTIPQLPWQRVIGFHMDEYVGISEQHPASFRRYMREELTSKVPMRQFFEIDGTTADPEAFCREYSALLEQHRPQLCLLGIGENGHLAFNDPAEADFNDPKLVKIVTLDRECRQQQIAEGWFGSLDDVPPRAITLTIPALFNIPELILSVPGSRKAAIVQRTLNEEISTACPATILRTHANAHLYVDRDSYPHD